MKRYLSIMLTVMMFFGVMMMSQIAGANESVDDGSTLIAASKSTNTLGKQTASEISKQSAEKKQDRKERRKSADRKLRMSRQNPKGYGMNPVDEALLKELPYEIRKQLIDIPQHRRTNWLIERLVERKAPMIAKRLCKNESFKKRYDKASKKEKTEMLERGLKYSIQKKMKNAGHDNFRGQRDRKDGSAPREKMQHQRRDIRQPHKQMMRVPDDMPRLSMKDMQMQRRGEHQPKHEMMLQKGMQKMLKNMSPEQREKFKNAPIERKLDFMAEMVIKHKGPEIKKMIGNHPELKKKLGKLSPEDRKAAVKKIVKKKMMGHIKNMKQKGNDRGFRPDDRNRMGKQDARPNRQMRGPDRKMMNREDHPRMMDRHDMRRDDGRRERYPDMDRREMRRDNDRREHRPDMDRREMRRDDNRWEHRPDMMRNDEGRMMFDHRGMQNQHHFSPGNFERELPQMMMHFMMENPERIRDFIRNLPSEIKQELRELLNEKPEKSKKKNKKGRKNNKAKRNKK